MRARVKIGEREYFRQESKGRSWTAGRLLGAGGQAEVFLARELGDGEALAELVAALRQAIGVIQTGGEVARLDEALRAYIRHVVIDRRITQGTRGTNGRSWSERIWTTMATCAAQGRSVFQFICQAVDAYSYGSAPPSLLPT